MFIFAFGYTSLSIACSARPTIAHQALYTMTVTRDAFILAATAAHTREHFWNNSDYQQCTHLNEINTA
jgi:hypothetical protein